MSLEVKNFEFQGSIKTISIVLAVVGVLALLGSFGLNKAVGWVDFLVSTVYFSMIAVSGIFFLSLGGVVQASWLTPYKRIPEAMTKFLPVTFVCMLVMYFGYHTLYEWTHTELVMNDPILREKVAWLNEPFFFIRTVIIFSLWILMAWALRSISKKMDTDGSEALSLKLQKYSAVFLIVFSLTISFAAFDWVMSIEPHWFSTIFGVYMFAGSFVSGIAFTTIAVIKLRDWGYLKGIISDDHLHDLGKWMFGMSVFWAYIWISQYLLIWYANIPEETEYYVLRHDYWNAQFFINLIINFIVPFFVLMTREAKRNTKVLMTVACILLFGHFFDMYLMVAPKVFHHYHAHISGYGILQLLQFIGFFGLFVFVVGRALSKMNLVSKEDPTLEEGLHLHQ